MSACGSGPEGHFGQGRRGDWPTYLCGGRSLHCQHLLRWGAQLDACDLITQPNILLKIFLPQDRWGGEDQASQTGRAEDNRQPLPLQLANKEINLPRKGSNRLAKGNEQGAIE